MASLANGITTTASAPGLFVTTRALTGRGEFDHRPAVPSCFLKDRGEGKRTRGEPGAVAGGDGEGTRKDAFAECESAVSRETGLALGMSDAGARAPAEMGWVKGRSPFARRGERPDVPMPDAARGGISSLRRSSSTLPLGCTNQHRRAGFQLSRLPCSDTWRAFGTSRSPARAWMRCTRSCCSELSAVFTRFARSDLKCSRACDAGDAGGAQEQMRG